MIARSIAEVLPDVTDFGEIPQKSDIMGGVYMGNNVVMTKLWTGHMFLASTNDMITAPHLINIGINEPHNTRAMVSLVKPGDVVVDIGANVGYFSVLAGWRATPGGQIWVFEPNPNLVSILSDNLCINGFKGMMKLHRKALSDRSGTTQMRIFPGYEATSSIREMSEEFIRRTADETGRESHLIDVELATLDDLMCDVLEIHVMKIDAEGHEPAIMRGAEKILRRSANLKIVMEFVPPIMGVEETKGHVSFLRSLGFTFNAIQFDGLIRPNIQDDELLSTKFLDILLTKNPS
jgi:FkbM family methyltransferase